MPPASKPPRRRVWPIAAVAAGGLVVIALLAISAAVVWSTRSQVHDLHNDMITSRDDLRRARADIKRVQSQLDEAQAGGTT
jgi:hypothetical protein